MPGRIDNVDSVVIPLNGGILRQDSNSTLPLLIIGVHDPLGTLTLAIERSRLLQQTVDQGRFAVINVRDNRDIAKILNHFSALISWWRMVGGVARADCTTVDCSVGLVILPSFGGDRLTAHPNLH